MLKGRRRTSREVGICENVQSSAAFFGHSLVSAEFDWEFNKMRVNTAVDTESTTEENSPNS
jgi:hypothetical protein